MCIPRSSAIALVFALVFLPVVSSGQTLTQAWQLTEMSRCIGCGGLSTADLDDDGIDEIIVTAGETTSRYVAIFKSREDSFTQIWRSPWYASAAIRATRIHSAGDTKELYVLLSDGTIEVYETDTFQLVRSGQLSATSAEAMAIGDVDHTGTPRIVVASATHLRIYDATTFESIYESSEFRGTDVKLGDVDGDGNTEIVLGTRIWWDRSSDGFVLDGATREVKWRFIDGFGSTLQLVDVTGDGRLDIVAMRYQSYSTSVRAFDGALRTPLWEIRSEREHRSMIVDDITGTGELAVVLGGRGRELQAFRVDTRQQMWLFTPSSRSYSAINTLATGVVTANGKPKLILGGAGESYASDGLQIVDPLTRSTFWTSPGFAGPFAITHADLTGNGRSEVVMAANSFGYSPAFRPIWILDENLTTIATATLPPAYYNGAFSVSAADVTRDGKAEIFISDGSNQLWMLGGESWQVLYTGEVTGSITRLEVSDIDADGHYEVVVSDAAGYLTVFDARSLTKKWSTINTGAAISGFALADCRMDGSQDIVLYAQNGFVQTYSADQRLIWQAGDVRGVTSMTAGDGQRTGVIDLYAGDAKGNIHVLDCADGSVKRSESVFDEPIVGLWLGDLDTSRERELVAGTTRMTLLRSTDYETIWQSAPFKGGVGARGNLHVVDLDGGRSLHFLVGTNDGALIYRSDIDYVDMEPPFAAHVVPVDSFQNASRDLPVQVTFSKAIAPETLDHGSFVISHGESRLDYAIAYDEETFRAVATPNGKWPENATVTVSLHASITDSVGNAFDGNRNGIEEGSLEDDLIWTFSTGTGVDSLGPRIVAFETSADTLWRGMRLSIEATAADTSDVATSTVARIMAFLDDVDSAPHELTPRERAFHRPVESGLVTFRTDDWPYGTRTIWLVAEDAGGHRGPATPVEIHVIVEADDNWATGGRDNTRTAYNPLDTLETPFSEAWSTQLVQGRAENPAAIADGVAYVSYVGSDAANPGGSAFVTAVAIEDGRSLWTWTGPSAARINPPAVAYGSVFAQSNNHTPGSFVYALNAHDGTLIWQEPYESQWSGYGAPAVTDGKVIVGAGYYDGMMAFDAFTGAQLWFHNLPQISGWTPAVFEGKAITPQLDGEVVAVNVDDGSIAWQLRDQVYCRRSYSIAIDADERVFYTGSERLMAIDFDDRSELWSKDGFCDLRSIALADENIYTADFQSLRALDKRTGELKWSFRPNAMITFGPVVSRAYVFLSVEEKTFALDRFSGEVVWTLEIGGAISLGNQHLIHVGHDGVLRAFVSGDPVSLEPPLALPRPLTLEQNFPNPFAERTHIRFSLPAATRATLKIYNALGQEVAKLVDAVLPAGGHEFGWRAEGLSSGVYFATLVASEETRTVRLVLAR